MSWRFARVERWRARRWCQRGYVDRGRDRRRAARADRPGQGARGADRRRRTHARRSDPAARRLRDEHSCLVVHVHHEPPGQQPVRGGVRDPASARRQRAADRDRSDRRALRDRARGVLDPVRPRAAGPDEHADDGRRDLYLRHVPVGYGKHDDRRELDRVRRRGAVSHRESVPEHSRSGVRTGDRRAASESHARRVAPPHVRDVERDRQSEPGAADVYQYLCRQHRRADIDRGGARRHGVDPERVCAALDLADEHDAVRHH